MSNRAAILIVDDEPTNIEILTTVLEDEYEIYVATSGAEAIEVARSVLPDLILLDIMMPTVDGYEVCARIKSDAMLADVPVIFTTALGDEQNQIRGLELGAIDYVTKPVMPEVVRARVRNHVDAKRMRDELARLAVTDALTGLSNRRGLEEALDRETHRLAAIGKPLSVIILDIDFFKHFNDAYGHTAGDRCLMMVASALNRAIMHNNEVAARYGGEEFACILPETSLDEAMRRAQLILERVQSLKIPHEKSQVAPFVTVSVGVTSAMCIAGADPDWWLDEADRQRYRAKEAGRNTILGSGFDAYGRLRGDISTMHHGGG
jgi:diguanylate cyclase (GGDEF)-like protein